MAIYHCCIKTVSRSDGRSATGAAAYRSGSCIVDERTGEIHDYTRKQGVEHSELVQPEGVNFTREELWNGAENAEKRKNSTVAREYEVALPDELNAEQRKALALDFARHLVNEYGVAADVAIHAPGKEGDQRNHHAHILTTTRQVTLAGFGDKTRSLDDRKSGEVDRVREAWESLTNRALERAGVHERVSHKSLEAQGIERTPTVHLGPVATAMERRGEPSERGELNRGRGEAQREREELATLEQLQGGVSGAKERARAWQEAKEREAAEAQRRADLERQRQAQERTVERKPREAKQQQARPSRGMEFDR